MMRKIYFVFLLLLFPFLFFVPVKAEGEFKTDVAVEYKVLETGKTEVIHEISIENLFSNLYATSYSLVLDNITPENTRAFEGNQSLEIFSKEEGTKVTLEIKFPNSLVGKNKVRKFKVIYDDSQIASRTGEVWEITIPRVSPENTFSSYQVVFSIPLAFGREAYLSPNPIKEEVVGERYYYTFAKEALAKTGVVAGFGEFQVFSFKLIYHLENPLPKGASIDIAIPPDTSLQKVYYNSLEPKPTNVSIDEDGNWLANYLLKPRERLNIEAKGTVQIFAGPRPFARPSTELLAKNLAASEFWPVKDSEIIALARDLKTAEAIYDFVTTTLSYDYEKVKPNITRLGALEALKNPKNAICMEFTDLFITLARAAGIPSREINGFAYTENPEIQPLSLVSDVLHSWPEYWDKDTNTWVSIDPTWTATTGGVDFFHKLDLRHFAFVIHGADAQKPYPPGSYKLGPNPQKDVFVNFGQLPAKRTPTLELSYETEKFIPFLPQKSTVTIKNLGPTSANNLPFEIFFDGVGASSKTISSLPPFAQVKEKIKIPFSFLGTKTPAKVEVAAAEQRLSFSTYKKEVIVYNLVICFALVIILLTLALVKLKKINLERIKAYFRSKILSLKHVTDRFKKSANPPNR